MTLLIIFIVMEFFALTGWYFDVTAYGDDVKTSFVNNHVVIVIVGVPFVYWVTTVWA